MARHHQTYPIQYRGDWCLCYFQAKAQHKHRHFNVHSGHLKPSFSDTVLADVLVFQSESEHRARRLTTGLHHVQNMINEDHLHYHHHPDLKTCLAVTQSWTQRVDSVEYFPGQKKTVAKEDTVVVQEHLTGQTQVVEYDDTCHHRDDDGKEKEEVEGVRKRHPVLAGLVDLSRRQSGNRSVISYLRAVLDQSGVYHLTSVAFRCCGGSGGGGGCSGADRRIRRGDCRGHAPQTDDQGAPDSCTFCCQPLEPSAPQPEVVVETIIAPEVLQPTAPEEEEEGVVHREMVASEEEEEEDCPPPPYCECVDRRRRIHRRPRPSKCHGYPPPPYSAIAG
ncbi:uncharacterized protein LOC143280902 [Babylonia areolata]|uniref:uncharacterized protein LOC143280902 n=1 Tax=Babylonia areolata TaxID=304850 RepID=UPI003FD26F00